MRTVLTIAGFDPSSGAGITADLMVFAAHGLFGTSCVTALTVQSTIGVKGCYSVDQKMLLDTLTCLDEDLPPDGVKIGMLASRDIVAAVCEYIERLRSRGAEIPVVVDPVLRSSSGAELLEAAGVDLLRSRLLPLADWVTPNRDELSVLLGMSSLSDVNREALQRAAEELRQGMPRERGLNILAKMGGTIPPDDLLLTPDGRQHWLAGKHVETTSTHGTGCALSSALLCRLVLGEDAVSAAVAAKRYVEEALSRAEPIGHGHGPMSHLWPLLRQ